MRRWPSVCAALQGVLVVIAGGSVVACGALADQVTLAYDFGQVLQGKTVSHVFALTNSDAESLTITSVRTSCSACTATVLSNKTIKPGEAARVEVSVDTSGYEGRITKVVELGTDDPKRPGIRLEVSATVVPEVRVVPKEVFLGAIVQGDSTELPIDLRPGAAKQFKVLGVKTACAFLATECKPGPGAGATDEPLYVVTVRLLPKAPIGRFFEKVVVEADCPVKPRLVIPIRGQVVGAISAEPAVFSFGSVAQGQASTRTILVRKVGAPTLKVLSAKTDAESLETEVKEVERGRQYEVGVRLKAGAPPGRIASKIRIETNDKDQPVLECSVYGVIMDRQEQKP